MPRFGVIYKNYVFRDEFWQISINDASFFMQNSLGIRMENQDHLELVLTP